MMSLASTHASRANRPPPSVSRSRTSARVWDAPSAMPAPEPRRVTAWSVVSNVTPGLRAGSTPSVSSGSRVTSVSSPTRRRGTNLPGNSPDSIVIGSRTMSYPNAWAVDWMSSKCDAPWTRLS